MPEVHYLDGMYFAFYTTSGPAEDDEFHHGEIIGYATSNDGITWDDAGIILEPGTEEDFDNWGIMAPTVSFQPDQTILFYSAWEKSDHPAFPVLPDGRFGMPISQDRTVHSNFGRAVSLNLRQP
jgi:sucrose-6-phosphate hydrolase SacC (GH32 family)